MTSDTKTVRLPRFKPARTQLTAEELEELRELYWELPSAAEAAAELLGRSGPAPTGMPLERLIESTERMATLLGEIDAILSR